MTKMFGNRDYYDSCDPLVEGNSGIWFSEEDPDDPLYNPKCCRDVYVDLACGYFDRLDVNDDVVCKYDYEYDAYDADDDNYDEYDGFEEDDIVDFYEAEGDDYD